MLKSEIRSFYEIPLARINKRTCKYLMSNSTVLFVYVLMGQSIVIVSCQSSVTQLPQGNAPGFHDTENGRHKAHCLLITLLGKEENTFFKRIFLSSHLSL